MLPSKKRVQGTLTGSESSMGKAADQKGHTDNGLSAKKLVPLAVIALLMVAFLKIEIVFSFVLSIVFLVQWGSQKPDSMGIRQGYLKPSGGKSIHLHPP